MPGFRPVLAALLLSRHPPVQALESLLCLAVVTRVLHAVPIGVRVEGQEADIDPHLCARWLMHHDTRSLYPELTIIAIGPPHNPHPFDVLLREGGDLLFRVPNETESPDTAAIGEGDVSPIGLELPPGLLVLDRAVVMLEPGIALLARLVLFALLIRIVRWRTRPDPHWLAGLAS